MNRTEEKEGNRIVLQSEESGSFSLLSLCGIFFKVQRSDAPGQQRLLINHIHFVLC
jgi:hypothetical protein